MAVTARQVKNKKNQDGVSTSRAGTVYDVFIKYKTADGYKSYGKRGFATKQEAVQFEAEMKVKLQRPSFEPIKAVDAKQTVQEYLEKWIDIHGKANLRPSTMFSYKSEIRNHIVPYIGNVPLIKVTPAMLDNLFQQLFDKGLAQNSVKYVQRILSVSFEAARKYHYIESNPARDILTKFGKSGKTPDPYTIEQMQTLLAYTEGTNLELIAMLGGLYGLRRGEMIGLRWRNIDLENKTMNVVEQIPFHVPKGTTVIMEMAPTKSNDRLLPITDKTLPYFIRAKERQQRQQELAELSGTPYYDNDFVCCSADGTCLYAEDITRRFPEFLRQKGLPHMRLHDLRHTAATNMHQLTGDFYTVGEILGHTLKGIGMSLGISTNFDAVTAQYVDVRLDRKTIVLEAYHEAVFNDAKIKQKKTKARDDDAR